MRNLTFFSLVGITSIAVAHAGWAAGHGGVFGSSGGFGGGHGGGGGGGGPGGEVAAEVERAPADLSPVVGPLTTIAEACITGTRASDRRVLRFINLLL